MFSRIPEVSSFSNIVNKEVNKVDNTSISSRANNNDSNKLEKQRLVASVGVISTNNITLLAIIILIVGLAGVILINKFKK